VTGIATCCDVCTLALGASNITGECRECKYIARAARAGWRADEVSLDEARTNFTAAFSYRHLDGAPVYGMTCRCGRFRARRDTRRCEWCSTPRRWPKRRRQRPSERFAHTMNTNIDDREMNQ
jgi:hypothetical protein